jgi:pyrroline-5-carboxylate reductase
MTDTTLSFIGSGNMTGSLVGGLIADGWDPARIRASDPDAQQLERLQQRHPIFTTTDNSEAVATTDVVVLAVKPQLMKTVALELAEMIARQQSLVISIAAGIREPDLRGWLGGQTAIVRTMPNTPALVQSGATALYANPFVSEDQRSIAESILRAVGLTVWVDDEGMMDAVTALSGSGPAYFFLLIESLRKAGRELGLPEDIARLLALQTAFGAARMALESNEDAATLRRRVTSPGGTTEVAIEVLQDGGFEALVLAALEAATDRSRELGDQLGAS